MKSSTTKRIQRNFKVQKDEKIFIHKKEMYENGLCPFWGTQKLCIQRHPEASRCSTFHDSNPDIVSPTFQSTVKALWQPASSLVKLLVPYEYYSLSSILDAKLL